MSQKVCTNCGQPAVYEHVQPVDTALSATWELSPRLTELFNVREGSICTHCGASIRAQGLARAILQSRLGFGATNLRQWVERANDHGLKVCELNSCHRLHDTLTQLKQLAYSEFGSDNEQNIEALTYADKSFDLVLHSETLEHVSRPGVAMDECRRILKPNGLILFTTPVIWTRLTRQRAELQDERLINKLPPSYHGQQTADYLVFFEYGRDIDRYLGVDVVLQDWRHQNYVFHSAKKPSKINLFTKWQLMGLQQLAVRSRRNPDE